MDKLNSNWIDKEIVYFCSYLYYIYLIVKEDFNIYEIFKNFGFDCIKILFNLFSGIVVLLKSLIVKILKWL